MLDIIISYHFLIRAEESREGALLTQLIEQIENHLDNNVLSTILKIQFRDGLHDLKVLQKTKILVNEIIQKWIK